MYFSSLALTIDFPAYRDIFPEGLPPSYVFVATLRLKGPSSKMTFDLWRVLSMDRKIQAAVTLNGKDKTVAFATTGVAVKEQSVVFQSGFQVWGFFREQCSVAAFCFTRN